MEGTTPCFLSDTGINLTGFLFLICGVELSRFCQSIVGLVQVVRVAPDGKSLYCNEVHEVNPFSIVTHINGKRIK